MPPRKEPKEAVVYAASKTKAPPFKPVRPSQAGGISMTNSANSIQRSTTPKEPAAASRRTIVQDDDGNGNAIEDKDDSDEELADNPLAAPVRRPSKTGKPTSKPKPTPKRKATRSPSPMFISDDNADDDPAPTSLGAGTASPTLAATSATPSLPQPLLVRLLHEHFADKSTKIDKQAIQVLQKYFELFVQEAIARAAARKQEDGGAVSTIDAGWLEKEDLEAIAAGLVLDF